MNAQVPAIQQLYQSLLQGLDASQKTQNQGILESATQRGVLRSTLPVDSQQALAAATLQSQGQLGAQQAQDVAGVREKLGSLQIQKVQGIQSLADTLYNRDLQERQFQLQQQQAEREYQLKQQQLAASSASRSSGGGNLSATQIKQQGTMAISSQLSKLVGKDGHVSNETWAAALNDFAALGGNARQFWQSYGQFVNPKFAKSYAGYSAR